MEDQLIITPKKEKILGRNKLLLFGLLVFAFIGFLDSSFLTFEHYQDAGAICPVFGRCDVVLGSKYSTVGPVPIALIGIVYYIVVFGLVSIYLDTKKEKLIKWFFSAVSLGFVFSLYFLYLQIFVIRSLCFYCILSLFATLVCFIFSLFLLLSSHSKK